MLGAGGQECGIGYQVYDIDEKDVVEVVYLVSDSGKAGCRVQVN